MEYLYLDELISLFRDALDGTDGWPDPLITALDELTDLRNTVMHSVKPLSDHRSPHELAELARDSEEIIEQLRDSLH